jgi:hypothetical protein
MSKQRAKTRAPRPGAKTPPKKNRPRPAPAKPRRFAPSGRPDGPLARRRRFRIRLLLVLLLLVNVAAWIVWPEWPARLAVLIGTVITAPMLAALLLRRKR